MFSKKQEERKLYAQINPRSPIAESYRTLRTNLSFFQADKPCKLLLITSAGPKDGKSSVTSNLGVVMAQAGSRVLIIDCDLRKPVAHKIFELNGFRGLTNLLVQDLAIEDVVSPTPVDGLWVLPSGPIPPNPSELLGSKKMKAVLDQASSLYDVVLLDTPPVITVTDASVLAPLADGVILVVKSGANRIDMVRDAKFQLDKANAKIIGVVLNDVKIKSNDYRYYYYYHRGGERGAAEE